MHAGIKTYTKLITGVPGMSYMSQLIPTILCIKIKVTPVCM